MDKLMAEATAEATLLAEAKATSAEAKGIIEALQELDFSPEDIIAMLMKKLQIPEIQAYSLLHR